MKNLFLKLNKENKEVYICGHFNINLLKYDDEIVVQDFYNLMNSNGYLPQINLPTRITDTTMTLIDNIFTNTMNYNSFSGNILIQIADHLSQFPSVDTSKIEYKKLDIYKRDNSNFNEQSFIEDISIQNWHKEYDDPNDCYSDFIFRLEGYVNNHAPLKKLNVKEKKMSHKPWITNEILKHIKQRDKLHSKMKYSNTQMNDVKTIYNQLRNKINREIDSSQKLYWFTYFNNYKHDTRTTWKGIKDLVNTKTAGITNITQIKVNGKEINDPKKIGNTFNNVFTNVGPNTDKTIPKQFKSPSSYLKII